MFSEGEAYAATQVLKTVIQSGTGTAANYGCPAAGKTGTTSSFTDAYFDGYTPKLATAVWVGYPNATESMANGFGGTLAAPIWHDFMSAASDGYCGDFTVPSVLWHGTAFVGSFSAVESAQPVDWLGIERHDRPDRPRLGRRRHQPGRQQPPEQPDAVRPAAAGAGRQRRRERQRRRRERPRRWRERPWRRRWRWR